MQKRYKRLLYTVGTARKPYNTCVPWRSYRCDCVIFISDTSRPTSLGDDDFLAAGVLMREWSPRFRRATGTIRYARTKAIDHSRPSNVANFRSSLRDEASGCFTARIEMIGNAHLIHSSRLCPVLAAHWFCAQEGYPLCLSGIWPAGQKATKGLLDTHAHMMRRRVRR
jgi:hypothetical protein